MKMAPTILFLLTVSGCASGASHLDVLNETVFNGNWSALSTTANDYCICEYPGMLYVISRLSSSTDERNRMCYRISTCEYRNCAFVGCDDFGSIVGAQTGEWISMLGNPFMMYADVWNRQTDAEHNAMNNSTRFLGVCTREWAPYMGSAVESTVQNHKHIWADPKIRFDKEVIIDGGRCVNTIDSVYVDANVWNSFDEIDYYRPCKNCDAWSPYFDYISTETNLSENAGIVTATVNVTLKWYYYHRDCHVSGDDIICYDRFKNTTEEATFFVSAVMPTTVAPSMIGNVSAQITMYNNSFDPYTLIQVDVPENVTITTFRYQNNTAKHFHGIGLVNNSSAAVEYRNDTLWKESPRQNIITHLDELCVIRAAPLNFTDLLITVSSPYDTVNVTNYSITMINSKPTDYVNFKKLFLYMLLIGIPLWGIIVNVRRWML